MSVQKVTIKTVSIKDTKKVDGVDTKMTYKSGKNIGKEFVMVNIQTEQTGDEFYSTPAMSGDKAMNLAVGQTVLLNFSESQSADGSKTFKNFNFPTKDQLAEYATSL